MLIKKGITSHENLYKFCEFFTIYFPECCSLTERR
uniref:Uncharacterized protein n=1 Tax=Siphoviridae sp. ctqPo10 TaxID=2827948 RepID=A0A8S5SVV2_9CAUD|nr:MAG TPA: hypothetical protein [Siphoviridae sp. ctqPo10]DAI19717.1 MAG TPA: hypothetical protein [Caudoviricetes sp.]DAK25472.1 MAG TPA: hypothetical protein [Caudoviricetes sp.]DAN25106.1 MAG TPA: hypothetical protein [Caudoviricetes sp.]DAS30639.1 MAG TPA: hypothetical protein [Caudoviricetes sp.]